MLAASVQDGNLEGEDEEKEEEQSSKAAGDQRPCAEVWWLGDLS